MSVRRAYPPELRSRVVAAVEQDELTIAEIASVFSVGLTFIKKMLRLQRAGGGPDAAAWRRSHTAAAAIPAIPPVALS